MKFSIGKLFAILFVMLLFSTVFFSASIIIDAQYGSDVYLNSRFLGTVLESPHVFEVENPTSGNLVIKKNGYSVYSVPIDPLGKEIYVEAIQIPLAKIRLNMNVESATIEYEFMNNLMTEKIQNNQEIEIPYNVEKIQIKKDGYFEKSVTFELNPFDKKNLDIQLLSLDEILIESNPKDAQIFLDGKFIGETPLIIKREDYSKITLKKEGYLQTTIKTLSEKDKTTVFLNPGVDLFVDSSPKDVGIFIDGKYIGNTPLEGIFPEGTYEMNLSKLGYQPKNLIIDLTSESLNKYFFEMEQSSNIIYFLNSNDYEFNIDGRNLGKGINAIVLDDYTHLIRTSKKDYILEFSINKNNYQGEQYLDLEKFSTINVFSLDYSHASFLGDTQKIPAFFTVSMLNSPNFATVRNLNRTYNILLEPSQSKDVFMGEGFGVLFITSNVEKPLIYIDGKFVSPEEFYGYPLKNGVYNIEARKFNEIKQQKITVRNGEKTYIHFEFDNKIPVIVNTKEENVFINSKKYLNTNQSIYLPSGPNVFSNGETSIVLFIYEPKYIDLDKLFGGL